jgi:RHS repeat-associated protein
MNHVNGFEEMAAHSNQSLSPFLVSSNLAGTGSITANPNPIQVCDGSGLGITTLTWSSSGTITVEVHVGSPSGALIASGVSGKVTTSKSVSDGTIFYLQDLSGKSPLTLATVTVGVTTAGCPTATPTPTPTPLAPVYEGWHDGADCSTIFGWAADRNRLNTSINVDIYDGATFLATVPANQSRPDVGAYLGDNGLHGFSYTVPASLKNGQPHSITVKFAGTGTNLAGTPRSITCSTCSVPVAPPPSSLPPDNVWVEDQAPSGAVLAGTWIWDTSQKASGSQSHTEPAAAGIHQHFFYGAPQPQTINPGDKLVSYVLLNPCNPPQEIMLQWNDSSGSWEHRAIWGADLIGWGVPGTVSRFSMGALPQTAAWVRLEVPASAVGLEGNTINGMAFTLYDGQAWFDRAGTLSRLRPISTTASNSYPGAPPAQAIDGNLGTMWNSGGFAPQWIQLDLGQPATISQIRLNVAQLPDGQTTHEIYGGTDPQALTLIRTLSGFTQSGQWLEPTFAPAINNIRYLKILTTASPSWVAWNEIEVYGSFGSADLVGYWKFDEGGGLTTGDSSGNGNGGTLQNGPAWTTGKINGALNFDGLDDYVQVGPAARLVMTNSMTIGAWVYPTATGSGIVVNKEGEYEIAIAGTVQWAIANTVPGWAWINTGYVVSLNQWTHIALVYDGTAVKTYANGALVHTYAASGPISQTTNDFRIGGRQCCPQFFQGRLDEVRVYNRALSATEIQTLANAPTGSRSPHNATQTPWPVPSNSNIEVEDFDDWNPPKGEGHTYQDDSVGNDWGLYRAGEDVDIAGSSDVGGGYVIGNAHGGEWLEYTVNITSSPCDVQVRVASGGPGGRFHVEFDGVNRTGFIQVPDTGSWGAWVTLTVPGVTLPLGPHIMRLALDQNGTQQFPAVADFNYIRIVASGGTNQPPTVSITSPANGATYTAPATVSISAAASDPDGTVSRVEFFGDGSLIGTVTVTPYNFTWSNVAAGTHSITAKATDNLGAMTTSAAVSITVNSPANQPPAVSITSPANGATYAAPATVSISAAASDPDGTVSKVEFFGDGSLIGTVTVAPYNFTWSNVAAGTHSITAKATDNLGAATTSAAVNITVNPPNPPPLQPPTDSLTVNQIGRLTSVGNGSMRIFNSYDVLGRTTQTVHKLDGTNYVTLTRYGYPQNSGSTPGLGTAVSFQSLPDFERLDYTYDAGGAQQSIKTTPRNGSQQTIVSSVRRNARGQTTQVVYGNGAVSQHSYNDATNLRLNQIKTVVGATTLQDYGYSFDNNGNVTGVTDNVTSTLSATYGYDDKLDQLTSMTPAGQLSLPYRYDNLGNLTNKENVTQTYGGAGRGPHALASSNNGTITYNYDANGNLTSTSNGTFITWNAENMPTQVVQGGITIYQKFFLGESLWKKVEPNVTTYYLPSMRVENGLFRKFFGGFAERSPDGSLKFYHNDHLGSASLVTDSAGNVIDRQSYMPYGEDRFISGSFAPKYQFNFKEKESTGFYDYGARLYNPMTGRWLSADSNTAGGLNRYIYVSNNPLRYTDPTGHQQAGSEAQVHNWAEEEAEQFFRAAVKGGKEAGIFARGIKAGNIHRSAGPDQVARALGISHLAQVPNFTGYWGGFFQTTNERAVRSFLKELSAAHRAGISNIDLRLVAHSNGTQTLLKGITRLGGSINPKQVILFAPNVSIKELDRLVSMTGDAPVRMIFGSVDMASQAAHAVPDPSMVARYFEGKYNGRVSVYEVNTGHYITDLAPAYGAGKAQLVSGKPPVVCCDSMGRPIP